MKKEDIQKQSSKTSLKVIISGGGTGGHIYPAIAIADEIRSRVPDSEILFVGALGKMEMEKVPKAGYKIKGLPISGIDRGNLINNFSFPSKLYKSLKLAKNILKEFNPDVAIGTGGYASGPLLWQAAKNNIPIVIQEQNSFPGITNKLLKNKAAAICTAYEEIYQFPKEKTHLTGNPIRAELFQNLPPREEAAREFGLNPEKPIVLSVGGSQGSRTLNNAWLSGISRFKEEGIQLIWQTGQLEYEKVKKEVENKYENLHFTEFIYAMQKAYAAADVIVSRAGAMAISELELIGKPTILVPFPFAAEDHQTKNAEALVKANAAIMISDKEAESQLVDELINLVNDENKKRELKQNILKLGKPNATKNIVEIILSNVK